MGDGGPTGGGDLLVVGIGELVTNAGGPSGPARDRLGTVRDAAVAIRGGRVAWTGPARSLPDEHRDLEVLDVEGRGVVPGFVDAHTHLPFAGDRADEFARRLRGESYQQALESEGGGIRATVRATRAAGLDDLVAAMRVRADRMLRHGTTTAEAKSGYGLDVDTEARQLAAIAALDADHPLELVPTFLGAHLMPDDAASRDGFLDLVTGDMLAACRDRAVFCDVFCDEGAFTVEESRRVLEAGRTAGLAPRIHANELAASGGAQLAAELGAASADHLAHVDEADAAALRAAGTVAVLLPATVFSLRTHRYAPARMLWDAGVTVALGTDCNPGTSYTESMPFVIALACLEMGLAPEEALWAATRGGARSLLRDDLGHLTAGAGGDLAVLDAPSHRHLPYRPGVDLVWRTVKRGAVVT